MKRQDSRAALNEEVQRAKLAALNKAYALAAKDPAFRADTNAVTSDFAATDRDSL